MLAGQVNYFELRSDSSTGSGKVQQGFTNTCENTLTFLCYCEFVRNLVG